MDYRNSREHYQSFKELLKAVKVSTNINTFGEINDDRLTSAFIHILNDKTKLLSCFDTRKLKKLIIEYISNDFITEKAKSQNDNDFSTSQYLSVIKDQPVIYIGICLLEPKQISPTKSLINVESDRLYQKKGISINENHSILLYAICRDGCINHILHDASYNLPFVKEFVLEISKNIQNINNQLKFKETKLILENSLFNFCREQISETLPTRYYTSETFSGILDISENFSKLILNQKISGKEGWKSYLSNVLVNFNKKDSLVNCFCN